ncbi:hypothetical protein FT663_02195 [Candidozyma haemuli var. vulneris]|nr:hypothetical protein FT662_02394 [[Candida] haemuloni var. vulneris]KAF3992682.1 hypothetical protein FT663_02195 [[Candida] haemuloni var. vulneris]
MCGIFLSVAQSLPLVGLECREYDEGEISSLVGNRLDLQTALSDHDKEKVKNADAIRQRKSELGRLSMKNHSKRIEELEREISELSVVAGASALEISASLDTTLVDIMARGPDYASLVEEKRDGWSLRALSSVLSLRQPFTKQPSGDDRYIFQFNGELYNEDCLDGNDVKFAWEKLSSGLQGGIDELAKALGGLLGEFAFVLTDKVKKKVYFGKDHVGKRSLLFSTTDGLAVASVFSHGPTEDLQECQPGILYTYSIGDGTISKTAYPQTLHSSPIRGNHYDSEYSQLDTRVDKLHEHLQKACLLRQQTVHPYHATKTQVAVLFSGGLDCTIIAALIAKNYTRLDHPVTIDLLTVGFENPRTGLSPSQSPDRQLSERSWYELSKKFVDTNVSFRLVQVDVSYGEWLAHRSRVLGLIHPTSTEMDLSIAIAFYFASRPGKFAALRAGHSFDKSIIWTDFLENRDKFVETEQEYFSSAKVLFSGLGADELYGGYSRHESIFDSLKEGFAENEIHSLYDELSASLMYDINAIYERNLGRDDRAISSWGKELRYPYLDNDVIEFSTNGIEPHYKIRLSWANIKTKKGEKRVKVYSRKYLLRQLAHKLDLPMAAEEVKRAIQFGAKSAKLEVGQSKTKGTEKVA